MAGFDDAALRVVHQDNEPSTTETIDAGDPGGVHSLVSRISFRSLLRTNIYSESVSTTTTRRGYAPSSLSYK